MTDETKKLMDFITSDNLFNAIRDVTNELHKKGYALWQIEEYLKLYFEDAEDYIHNQLN